MKEHRDRKRMWVFGYGSLMWDPWETAFQCSRSVVADLRGFQRSFNKASIKRWGTKEIPGPTLNVVSAAEGVCRGIAFEFPAANEQAVRRYLRKREGETFPLREHNVYISEAEVVAALVPIYEGPNVVRTSNTAETAEIVCRAAGSAGRCIEYVTNISEHLAELGIHDPAVTELMAAVRAKGHVV